MSSPEPPTPVLSIVVVSFNTRALLLRSLATIAPATRLPHEIIVVDCASRDGSAEAVAEAFPQATLLRSDTNLGFGAANNRGFAVARGEYVVLLNSDAFLEAGALDAAVALMREHPRAGLGGARLVGEDGAWQPSMRRFPTLWGELLVLSGRAARWPRSRVFGAFDYTWADPAQPRRVDWVPGAFSIVRGDLLRQLGGFDERFFLYSEEVDLCRRVHAAGYDVWYWPALRVVHLGGESARTHESLAFSETGAQLELWRMRSRLLYYRKHHGACAWWAWQFERQWFRLRAARQRRRGTPEARSRAEGFERLIALCDQAWRETEGGRTSPPRPW